MWQFENENFAASRRHQGTEALQHFAQKLTGVLPGNGLFIIAGCTFFFFFVQAKKIKEKNYEYSNSSKLSALRFAFITSLRFFSRSMR